MSAELDAQVEQLLAPLSEEDERAYFDSLQAAGAAPGLVVRRCGERGKGLFATRDFEEGEVILREQPLVAIQQEENKEAALACSRCFRYVGSVEAQIARRLLSRVAAAGDAADAEGGDAAAATLGFDPAPLNLAALAEGGAQLPHSQAFPLPAAVACPGGCGTEVYCSEACADAAWREHHCLLCTGPGSCAGNAEGLREFWAHTAGTNDIFGLVARVIAGCALGAAAACGGEAGVPAASASAEARFAALSAAWRPYAAAHKLPWWRCVSRPADVPLAEEPAFRDSIRRLADSSRRRLAAALPAQAAAFPALFDLRLYGVVIGTFELNNLDVVVESPVENYFLLIDDLAEPARAEAMRVCGPLLDALDSDYATPLDGTGFFPFVACANHDCAPAAGSSKGAADVDGGAVLVAQRHVAAGEEVTICYIHADEQSVRKRREALADYGFRCECARCAADDARRAARKAAAAEGSGGVPVAAVPRPRARKTK